jgi:hypothetical protein
MMIKRQFQLLLAGLSAVLVVACGGGGSDAGAPTATTTAFPLLAGYKAFTAAGGTNNYMVTGSCNGSATATDSVAVASTFEGVDGYATTSTKTLNLTNCTPATSTTSGTTYYDSNYTPLGSSAPSGDYTKVVTLPPPLPSSVKVGDAGVLANFTAYTDSTKTMVTGSSIFSYVIEADTASTAIVNVINRDYDTANNLLLTQQARYRIASDGKLTSITIDLQFSTTSTLHILLTKV